ncbi:MAG: hypothetical protein QF541_12745 [Lentisphaeria bacterium]|nr:hypothetical protein [Lentisphaeria bacterium]
MSKRAAKFERGLDAVAEAEIVRLVFGQYLEGLPVNEKGGSDGEDKVHQQHQAQD